MRKFWTRDFLTRRIDRCYLVASWARTEEKREIHLGRARHYREMLARLSDGPASLAAA